MLAFAAVNHSASDLLKGLGLLVMFVYYVPVVFPDVASGRPQAALKPYATALNLLGIALMLAGHALQRGWI
ncbi:MAG: hypothetical protein K2X55_00520 [Burkholderiaceae bacterium]|nr:hypothetical protein [Burkholderiaceae bacterium]